MRAAVCAKLPAYAQFPGILIVASEMLVSSNGKMVKLDKSE